MTRYCMPVVSSNTNSGKKLADTRSIANNYPVTGRHSNSTGQHLSKQKCQVDIES
jgi:hypothetical protein